jgi:signal transduction histidine kinase
MIERPVNSNDPSPRRQVRARSAAARPPSGIGSSAELRAVLEAMPETVLVCDADDRVRLVNNAADRLFAGRPVHDMADLLDRFEPLTTGPPGDRPLLLQPRDGPDRLFELRTFPVDRQASSSDGAGRIIVLRDVTDARRARAERRTFLAILSHELRTPITTIYAGSRVLARNGRTGPSGSEIAADISAEAAHLYDLVEDLLVLTRAEQGLLELSVEPVLVQRIVEMSVRLAASRTPGLQITTSGTNDPPAVRGDPVYIEQVIRNLVTAASRFEGGAAPVVIHVSADEREVSVRVLDRGPDLRPREAERLLELVEDPRGPRPNIGIGPFVCRRIIESMGGRIWAMPRDGGGAEIGFALARFTEDGLSA